MFYTVLMDTLIKLREIAVHMGLEPDGELRTPNDERRVQGGAQILFFYL